MGMFSFGLMLRNFSPLKSKKAISYTLLLLSLIALAGLFVHKSYIKHREEKALEKWELVQSEAAAKGIHTDIDEYLASIAGDSPKLFEDFPWVREFIKQNPKRKFTILKREGFEEFTFPSSSKSHQENLENLRSSLSNPPHANA